MFRVLTIAREFGSGGGVIARRVAEELRWNLLDDALVGEVARAAQVDPTVVKRYDEHVEPWWRRLCVSGLRAASIFGGVAPGDAQLVDPESTMAACTQSVIAEAAAKGKCVIVGRGAECALQSRTDVLHVFIYGPWNERVSRVRSRVQSVRGIQDMIWRTDHERASYIRDHYGCDWNDAHLYHTMLSSQTGLDTAARTIVDMVGNARVIERRRIVVSFPASRQV